MKSGTNHTPDTAPSILILGTGSCQIEAVEHCKSLGYRVLGCSYRNTDPGIALLDEFRQIDIRDIDSVIKYAREKHVDAVYSVGSDIAIPTAMKASEELGLPKFFSYSAACTCQDKGKMRTALSSTKWSVPFITTGSADEAIEFGCFPSMMKPVDSQGQRGCFRLDSEEDVRRYFDKSVEHSNSGVVIVEKFIDGPEISVNAFMRNGELEFMMPSDRYSFSEYPGGIIKEHGIPCRVLDDEGYATVEKLVKEVTRTIGIANGPVYFQMKMDGQRPYLLEIAPRLDGCHLWRLIKHYCGYDLLAATFDLLMNADSEKSFEPKPIKGDWMLTFMCSQPNVPFDRDNYDVSDSVFHSWYYETGDIVHPINGFMEKCGYRIREVRS